MNRLSSSFRDPSGFIFKHNGKYLRQINHLAKNDYDLLLSSGLFENLVSKGLLINHQEIENINDGAYKTIEPEQLNFISYPYEWSFEQLKDAALCTLRIQRVALKHGMSLKDSSAYNIQFLKGKPVFIDTLSFEAYDEGKPWVAYRQFCQHFLAPLALASYKDIRMLKMLSNFIDGIPLDLASSLLPGKTKLNFALASHIHWHSKAQNQHADKATDHKKTVKVSKNGLLGIISNLQSTVKKLKWNANDTEWGDYYNNTNYSKDSFDKKLALVSKYLEKTEGNSLIDLGANDGTFSNEGVKLGMTTIAFDIDPVAVNKNYLAVKKNGIDKMLPLILDLTNPSPGLGWAHEERESLEDRCNVDCVMALALVHHLAISNNLPLEMIAQYFSKLGTHLVIEFVPKEDSKVQTLLATREDIFPRYNLEDFQRSFENHFTLVDKQAIEGSLRTLFLFRRK